MGGAVGRWFQFPKSCTTALVSARPVFVGKVFVGPVFVGPVFVGPVFVGSSDIWKRAASVPDGQKQSTSRGRCYLPDLIEVG
jgi:hypothetical protein